MAVESDDGFDASPRNALSVLWCAEFPFNRNKDNATEDMCADG